MAGLAPRLALVAAVAAVGCGRRGGDQRAQEAAVPPAAAGPAVRILVDGQPAGEVSAADLAARPLLSDLVGERAPAASWRQIEADAPGGRTLIAVRPGEVYRGQDAIAYLEGGQPALGMFRRPGELPSALRDLGASPTIALAGITEIRIRTREVQRPDPPPVLVELTAGGKSCTLDAGALQRMRRAPVHSRADDRPSWDVRDLVRRCYGAAPRAVRAGALHVDAAMLARADRLLIAKVNRRGVLHVRLLVPGTPPRVLQDSTPARIEVDL